MRSQLLSSATRISNGSSWIATSITDVRIAFRRISLSLYDRPHGTAGRVPFRWTAGTKGNQSAKGNRGEIRAFATLQAGRCPDAGSAWLEIDYRDRSDPMTYISNQ